jgi:hypothetical protein
MMSLQSKFFYLGLMLFAGLSHADSLDAQAVAHVLQLHGTAGTAGEPRRQELTADTVIYADKLVILDPAATLIVRYQSGDEYEFTGPALIVMQRERPIVVEGNPSKKRATK